MHELSFFMANIGKTILRNNKPVEVRNEKDAKYFFELQDYKYTYTMSDDCGGTVIDFDLPEVVASSSPRVHYSMADSMCISCEG